LDREVYCKSMSVNDEIEFFISSTSIGSVRLPSVNDRSR
jgi:hypothetical protein